MFLFSSTLLGSRSLRGETKLLVETLIPSDDTSFIIHDVQAKDWRPYMYNNIGVLFAGVCALVCPVA